MSAMLKYFRISAIIFTTLALFWVMGFIGFNVHIKGIPSPKNERTDAIIVLTGGPDRINAGLDLLADKRAKHLFISGVNTKVSVEQLVSLWREDLRRPPCCIVLGHIAKNTFENATEARDWIEVNNIKSARLLTENYHMPRAWLEFISLMPQMDLHPHAITPDKTSSVLIVQEYNKTLFTLLRLKLAKVRR